MLASIAQCILAAALPAHGGQYNPPLPVPPKPPTYTGPGDHSRPPPRPASAPGGGSTPGPASPGGPSAPSTPRIPQVPGTPTGGDGLESTSWEHWWRFNKDAYLELKARVGARVVVTTSGDAPGSAAPRARALALLEGALATEHQQDVVSSALIGLARTCDGELRAQSVALSVRLTAFLSDANQEIAETAAAALGILGCESSIPLLADVLHDNSSGQRTVGKAHVSERTRAFAAFALALAAQRADHEDARRFALHHLIAQLNEPMGAMPDVHAACVIGIGLVPLAAPDERGNVQPATDSRSGHPREAQVRMLIDVLEDRSRHKLVRAHAGDALAKLACDADGNALRERAARAILGIVAGDRGDPDEVVRGGVAALGRLGDADRDPLDVEIRSALRRKVESGDQHARLFALIALGHIGARGGGVGADEGLKSIREMLVERLVRGPQRDRCWSALALGVLERERLDARGTPSADTNAALRRALEVAGAPNEVAAVSIACGLARVRDAGPAVLAKLEKVRDPDARGYIAVALGMLEERAAVAPLHAVLDGARFQPVLLHEAAIALALLGDDTLVPTLIESLRVATSQSSQAAVATAVGFCCDDRALEPLARLFENPSSTTGTRAFAAAAIGLVCDQDRIPWNARISAGFNYAATVSTQTDGNAGILDIF